MKVEKSGIKITLSAEEMEVLYKARDILNDINDEIEDNKGNDMSCIVTTENGIEFNHEVLWDAFVGLDNMLWLLK